MKQRMQDFLKIAFGAAMMAAAVVAPVAPVTADDLGEPVISGAYGWEDGEGTILGSFGNLVNPINVGPDNDVDPNTGERMLRVTEAPHSGTPQAYVAYIEHLEHGDVVVARFWGYDPGTKDSGQMRIWAHYADSGNVNSYRGSAGGNNDFTSGIGWEMLEHTWTFDSDGDTRDALVIEVRLYSTPPTCGECSTDFYIDDVSVEVYKAGNENVSITFPDDLAPPDDPDPCKDPDVDGSFDWGDGLSTVLGTFNNVSAVANVTHPEPVYEGDHSLRLTEAPHLDNTPEGYLAFIENLQDGDVITASFWAYDPGDPGSGQMRIWGHYAQSGDPNSFAGSAGGNPLFTGGIGWQKLEHTWIFNSDGGTRDALIIKVRLYSTPQFDCDGSTDYYVDLVEVNVCSNSPAVNIVFPTPEPDLGEPDLEGEYGWEDGKADILGFFVPFGSCFGEPWAGLNLHAENVGAPNPVHSGERSLMLTEEPHCNSVPQAIVAYIENLQHGDVIHAGFHAFDETPGAAPSVRIWGSYANSGDVNSFRGSAGGNNTFSSGCGWDELTHEWVFDEGDQFPPRSALKVEVRLYSDDPDCPECSTDYFIDDLWVQVWSQNPNATITFPDGTVIGDPGVVECAADVLGTGDIGFFDQLEVLDKWGPCPDPNDCPADVNGDEIVDGADLGIVLGSYGSCDDYLNPVVQPISLSVETSSAFGPGLVEHRLYIQLPQDDDSLVNVYNADITSTIGFESGSEVTIGLLPPPSSVQLDPNFDDDEFQNGNSLGDAAGWFNSQPVNNNVGRAGNYPDRKVLIASFIVEDSATVSGNFWVTYRQHDPGRAAYGNASFVIEPADTCTGDLNGDGIVNVSDLLLLFDSWGPCPGCTADFNDDGVVNVSDLLILFDNWGPCP
jgi:hypothetical protein